MASVTKILGHDIHFPDGKKPFPAQLAVMSKALQAMTRRENALLESPTGTGKTLALLASSMAWLKQQQTRTAPADANDMTAPEPIPTTKTFEDFIYNPQATPASPSAPPSPSASLPQRFKIYYTSRTHSQLQQVIDEFRTCHSAYDNSTIKMSILAARSHLCINREVVAHQADVSIDEACAALHKPHANPPSVCLHRRGNFLEGTISSLRQATVFDIEDSLLLGKKHRGCPYYSMRELTQTSDIIFAPYVYLINPTIRAAMRIDTTNSVLIFDEAHNIEDTCREAASASLNLSSLQLLVAQLQHPPETSFATAYSSLYQMFDALLAWLARTATLLQTDESSDFDNTWYGSEAVFILDSECGLNKDTLAIFREHLDSLTKEENELDGLYGSDRPAPIVVEYEENRVNKHNRNLGLTSASMLIMKNFFATLEFLFQEQNHQAYRMVIQRTSPKWRSKRKSQQSETLLHFWCLSAAVAFKPVTEDCHCVLLTSGTLSPLDSFAGELGVPFSVRVEAGHVINMETQVKVAAVSAIGDIPMHCVYQTQTNTAFQEALGQAALALARSTPGGVLLFFPSYTFMDRVLARWVEVGIDEELARVTDYYVEPRDSKSLDDIMDKYYESVKKTKHAMLLAVCRGKVSEGIDFADNYARTVVVIGIPFPNFQDLNVKLKKTFQNEARVNDASLVSGDVWYSQQAFRAVNQAVGRCIRHKRDYGAIILLDTRFSWESNQKQLSRWMRAAVGSYAQLSDVVLPMRSFFDDNFAAFGDNSNDMKQKSRSKIKSARKKPVPASVEVNEGDEQHTLSQMFRSYSATPRTHSSATTPITTPYAFTPLEARTPERITNSFDMLTASHAHTPMAVDVAPADVDYLDELFSKMLNVQWRTGYDSWPGVHHLELVSIPKQLSYVFRVLGPHAVCIVNADLLDILHNCTCRGFRFYEQWHAVDNVVYREISRQQNGNIQMIMVQVLACGASTLHYMNHTYATHDFCISLQEHYAQSKPESVTPVIHLEQQVHSDDDFESSGPFSRSSLVLSARKNVKSGSGEWHNSKRSKNTTL